MQKYTLGFVFDAAFGEVLLMHKAKPEWQAGKINGLGGKMESGEESRACIMREIREEAGLETRADEWVHAGKMHGIDWMVDVYGLCYTGRLSDARSMEDEQIEWFSVNALPSNALSNLTWLIPLVRDRIRDRSADQYPAFMFSVEYR